MPVTSSKTFRTASGFVVLGTLTSALFVPPFYVAKTASESQVLVKARYKINGGTSITFKIQNNGADITGFGTTASPLTATTTVANSTGTVSLADEDALTLVLITATGTPVDLAVSLAIEHTV